MKSRLKYVLSRFGIFPALDLLRRCPDILRWLYSGCRGTAPAPVKRMALAQYAREYHLKRFVETGTHLGDTLAYVARDSTINATSIELAEFYFDAAERRFRDYRNVTVLKGDSGALMPGIVEQLREPTLFRLDGHYSGGRTGKDELDTPVSAELEAILQSPIEGHVILIDDAHCFDGTHDYPNLDDILSAVRIDGKYEVEVSADIIRITPTKFEA